MQATEGIVDLKTGSLKTLFITRYTPYPPMGGTPLRNWQNINVMKHYGPVAVFSVSPGTPQMTAIPEIKLWHHYNTDRELSRRDRLERQLWVVRPDGQPDVDKLYAIAAARELKQVLTKFQPDLVIFAELWLYRYFKVLKQHGCFVIFDNHNVEADLFQQGYGSPKLQLPRLKTIERSFLRQADQVWACSEDDVLLLKQMYRHKPKIYAIPNGINVAHYDSVRAGQCSPPTELEPTGRNLLFLGQYNFPPNRQAAEILLKQIYPQLKKTYPDCRLLLVGRNQTPSMSAAAKQDPNVIVTGSVADVRPYLAAASVMILPLLQGSGTRLKIIEAFAAGCPVVSTEIGAKGLNAQDGKHLLIRSVEELGAGVEQLWSEPGLREKLIQSAYELVQAQYSWEASGSKIEQAVQNLLSRRS